MSQEKRYSTVVGELLEDARQMDWAIWNSNPDELTRDVPAVMSFVSHLSRTAARLLDLRRLKESGHKMRFKDYVKDKQIVDHLKMLRNGWGRMKNIIVTYTDSPVDESPQDREVTLDKGLAPCGEDEMVEMLRHSVLDFCQTRHAVYKALHPLMLHYQKIIMDSMILIVRERNAFVSMWKARYEDWLQQNRPSIERRLKNGLYKSGLYGKTIIPLQSTPPCCEHWGEALGLKMQQIRKDSIYSFIDDDEFHEVGSPIELTGKLLIKALDCIMQGMPADAKDGFLYDEQMEVFYGHIAEINILTEKIKPTDVEAGDDAQKDGAAASCDVKTGKNDTQTIYPAMALLEGLVRDAIEKKKGPKYILMPVRAAKDAGVLIPIHDVKDMNEHFKDELKDNILTKQSWSLWISKLEYDPRELEPLTTKFKEYVKSPHLSSRDGIGFDNL